MAAFLSTTELIRLNNKALQHISNKNYSDATRLLELALSSSELSPSLQFSLLCNLAFLFNCIKDYSTAIDYLIKALSLKKKLSTNHIVGGLINLAVTLSYRKNHIASIKYSIKALKKLDPEKHSEFRAVIYFNVAIEYFYLKKTQKAMEYFRTGWTFSHNFPENSQISKLLLSGCTNFLPVLSEAKSAKRINGYYHKRSRTYIGNNAGTVPITPRAPIKSNMSISSIRNKVSLTESSPIYANFTHESSLNSPIFMQTSDKFAFADDEENDQNLLCALKKKIRNYTENVSDFMKSCKKISNLCFAFDFKYYQAHLKKIVFLQRKAKSWLKTRQISAGKIQKLFRNSQKILQHPNLPKSSLDKYKPKLHSWTLKSILKRSLSKNSSKS